MSNALSFRQFVEEVEKRLAACSADELRAIILNRAKQTAPAQRWAFLAMWTSVPADEPDEPDEQLLDEIRELAETVASGELCDGWGYDHAIGEERDWGDESWAEDVDAFFERARDALLSGDYALAEKAYAALFEILAMGEESGHLPGNPDPEAMLETDLREARLSYLRAVYGAAAPAGRPARLLEVFQKHEWRLLNLQQVMDAGIEPLPDMDRFLPGWIDLLRETGCRHDLLREAVRLAGGVPALTDLARREGKQHPAAFVDWLQALEETGDYRAVREAAREGLAAVSPDYVIRARIAEGLRRAGERLGLPDDVLTGRREAFYADPTLDRFLDLVSAAGPNREAEEEAAIARLRALLAKGAGVVHPWDEETLASHASQSLLVKVLLLTGRHGQAFALCGDKDVLGWSGGVNPKGLVVPFLLVLLAGGTAAGPNLASLWNEATTGEYGSNADRFRRAMDDVFRRLRLAGEEEEKYLAWCVAEAGRRVDAIVGGQHRHSYHKAAVLLAAAAEVLAGRQKKGEAAALIDRYHQKYHRHRAFRQELAGVTKK